MSLVIKVNVKVTYIDIIFQKKKKRSGIRKLKENMHQ